MIYKKSIFSTKEWHLKYPKHFDLEWQKSTKQGKVKIDKIPYIDSDMTEYNKKNVNVHTKDRGTLETFL